MKRHRVLLAVLGLAAAALAGAGLSAVAAARSSPGIVSVSMIQLIANPAAYHGKKVRLVGYLHDKFEDSAIYLSKEDADYLNGMNGLWVSYGPDVSLSAAFAGRGKPVAKPADRRYFDCKMVLLEGVFDKDGHGHMGMWAGEIKNADRLLEQTRWTDGRRDLVKP